MGWHACSDERGSVAEADRYGGNGLFVDLRCRMAMACNDGLAVPEGAACTDTLTWVDGELWPPSLGPTHGCNCGEVLS